MVFEKDEAQFCMKGFQEEQENTIKEKIVCLVVFVKKAELYSSLHAGVIFASITEQIIAKWSV